MQQTSSSIRHTDAFSENLNSIRKPYLQSNTPASRLLHSKWGGRHPTRLPERGSLQSRDSLDGDRDHQNYFEEFREKVLRIRDVETTALENTPKSDVGKSNSQPSEFVSKSNSQQSELVEKLKRQNDKIEELELIVRELRTQQLATKRQHEHEVSNLKIQLKQKERNKMEPRPNAEKNTRFHVVHEAEINDLRQENAALLQRNKEIVKRAKVLALIHQHRVCALEAKLQSSLSINYHYLNDRETLAYEEDSTMQLLNEFEDNTTALLLRGASHQKLLGNKSKLRSCILAVLFTVRVKRQAHNERAWRMEVMI